MKTLAEIDAAVQAAIDHLAAVQAERLAWLDQRKVVVIAAFDAGSSRDEIVAALNVTYPTVVAILHRAGRSERQRRLVGLSSRQRADYERLVRAAASSKVARAIATNIGV